MKKGYTTLSNKKQKKLTKKDLLNACKLLEAIEKQNQINFLNRLNYGRRVLSKPFNLITNITSY